MSRQTRPGGVGAVVLGLDFGGTKTAAAVADLGGRVLATQVVDSLAPGDTAEQTFARGLALGAGLVATATGAAAGAGLERLAAVGACTFGIPFDDRVELAPTIPGWDRIAFGERIRSAFPGVQVRVATDVRLRRPRRHVTAPWSGATRRST